MWTKDVVIQSDVARGNPLSTTGGHVWSAVHHFVSYFETTKEEIRLDQPQIRVLELGAGCGLLGMTIARNIPTIKEMCLTEMEMGGALEHLEYNISINCDACVLPNNNVTSRACDWSVFHSLTETNTTTNNNVDEMDDSKLFNKQIAKLASEIIKASLTPTPPPRKKSNRTPMIAPTATPNFGVPETSNRIVLSLAVLCVAALLALSLSGKLSDVFPNHVATEPTTFDATDIKNFRLAAESGDVKAQHLLAVLLAEGKFEESHNNNNNNANINNFHQIATKAQNEQEALKWYLRAAEQNFTDSQYHLGVMFVEGRGTIKNDREAVKWFRLAAEKGHVKAQTYLGAMYGSGAGFEKKDEGEAVKWYRMAAEKGHLTAQYNMGVVHEQGKGVARDEIEAVKWYRMAAEQGETKSMFNLGVMYATGRGVGDADEKEAMRWYRNAAELGVARAQTNLGMMFQFGKGVERNEKEAVKWYRLAASQGDKTAQRNLRMLQKYSNSNHGRS
eukprot:c12356_g4_i1.p1 GENE.c12356_g4_i1~~c12356_g4_i1.p1  ORF type:complete len:517 (+),score=133.60 c12356_g4_i1:45-1553(+)